MGSGGPARVKATPAQVPPKFSLKEKTLPARRSFLEMGNSRSQLQLQEEEINEITAETGFTKQQIERLYARFTSLDKQNHGYLTREDFLRIPELAINPLGDRIVHAFFYESKSQGEEKADFKDFVRVVAHFRPVKKNPAKNKLNTRHEKLHFAFRMYDLDGDDKISKEELLAVLTMMVGANISPEQLLSIAERTILEADEDKDELISFEEFVKVLERTDVEQKMSIRFLN